MTIAFLTSLVPMALTSILPGILSGLAVNSIRATGSPAAKIAARLIPSLMEGLRGSSAQAAPQRTRSTVEATDDQTEQLAEPARRRKTPAKPAARKAKR